MRIRNVVTVVTIHVSVILGERLLVVIQDNDSNYNSLHSGILCLNVGLFQMNECRTKREESWVRERRIPVESKL